MKKNKEKTKEVKLEKLNDKTNNKINISQSFYYILGLVLSIILIFATEEFLSTINYLFVVIFSIVAVIKIITFIFDKKYINKDYSDMVEGIVSMWLAIFIFRYGQFLFLQMLPVLVSIILFMVGLSSSIKYFDKKNIGNLTIAIISLLFGVLLLTLPQSIMYICFKVVGVYLFIIIILDMIDYKRNISK